MFSSPDEVAVALKDAGFDVIFTANNHSADKNKKGIERTIDVLDSLQFNYTGTFKDSLEFEKLNPLFIELGELKFAFINATYGTNGMLVPLPNIVQSLDTNVLKQSFIKAKQHQSDYIIAYLHWGNEYERKASVKQQNLAKFCANNGVDFIIGSHPHVLQPFEIIQSDNGKDVPVFYSLGNFISNQRDRYKDGGGLLELNFFKIENEFGLHSVGFTPTWTYKGRFEDKFQYYIVPVSLWENNTSYFGFSKTDSIKISQFANDSRKLLNNISEIKFYEQQ
jgi:poly-gamma-glutamate synthesis protein (capsule biosynthesis protein)